MKAKNGVDDKYQRKPRETSYDREQWIIMTAHMLDEDGT